MLRMRLGPLHATLLLLALGGALTFLPGRKATSPARSTPPRARVGLVFDVGGRGDKSFNDAAFAGLVLAEKELDVETSFLEPLGAEDREAALRLFASRGLDLVIGVGYIFSSDVDAVARSYPAVHFACVDYAPGKDGPPPNVAGLSFREEEGSFLVGAVAGLLSTSHHVGFVGGMTSPLIRKFEAGYEAGVKAVCAECTVHSAYVGASPDAYKDPAKGKALAIAQISAGADVLYHASGASGHGVFEGAHDARVMAIGVDADQHDEMPDTVVTSMVKRVDVVVADTIRSVVEGRFEGGMHVFGVKDGAIDYVHEGPHAARIPDEVKARVTELEHDILEGQISVPFE
jgi:basic membrane protein A and related proteins